MKEKERRTFGLEKRVDKRESDIYRKTEEKKDERERGGRVIKH